MRGMALGICALVSLALQAPDSIHADQGVQGSSAAANQGIRWARSAVTPFKTVAMGTGGPSWRTVRYQPVTYGRGHATLPDFSEQQDVQTKKLRFFSFLLPLVDEENERLLDLRMRLSFIQDHVRWHRDIDQEDKAWLLEVVEEFRIPDVDIHSDEFWETALRRVDAVPDHLVLAQAANESAWGTSRFAREGNNLFGQWCFRKGCGLVPLDRPAGATYEVARFESVSHSIGSYMHNLNTGRTYRELREIRAAARQQGRQPDAVDMAGGLLSYSERGEDYIKELRAMIRYNAVVIEEARTSLSHGASS